MDGACQRTRLRIGSIVGLLAIAAAGCSNTITTDQSCTDTGCDDGRFCNGAERCLDGGCIVGIPPCLDDGLFCNGTESCNEATDRCENSGDPCAALGLACDEVNHECVCDDDSDCDDGQFCNGAESCGRATGACVAGVQPCSAHATCNESEDTCGAGNTVTLFDGDSYDFFSLTRGEYTGGEFYFRFEPDGWTTMFFANNVPQRGTQHLGNLGDVPLSVVSIPSTGYTRFGSPVYVGDTYVALGHEGYEDSYVVFRVTDLNDLALSTTIHYAIRTRCQSNLDCDDGLFCNGFETCDTSSGVCAAGTPPCDARETCDEEDDSCPEEGDCYESGVPLTLTHSVTPPAGTIGYTVEEFVPPTWSIPTNINNSGEFDAGNQKVKWAFTDGDPRTLSFTTTPTPEAQGEQCFALQAQVVDIDGNESILTEESTCFGRCP